MPRANVADLPQVTDEHRRAAFDSLCLAGTTYESAMQDDTRRRIVEARAHQLRTRQWKAEKNEVIRQHITATACARLRPVVHDLKRAAAGDFDD